MGLDYPLRWPFPPVERIREAGARTHDASPPACSSPLAMKAAGADAKRSAVPPRAQGARSSTRVRVREADPRTDKPSRPATGL